MKSLALSFVTVVLLIQLGCNCDHTISSTKYLTSCEKKLIPYEGNAVLKFLANNDTISLVGQGLVESENRYNDYYSEGCKDSYVGIVNSYTYKNNDYGLEFILTPSEFYSDAVFEIRNSTGHRINHFEIGYCSGTPSIPITDTLFTGQNNDTLRVLGKLYHNVYNLRTPEDFMYFSFIDGIIKFTDKEMIFEKIPED